MKREHYIRTKDDTTYTDTVRLVYNCVKEKFQYSARITSLIEMLKYSFGVNEWSSDQQRELGSAGFMSYLGDQMIKFKEGKPVDFTEVYESILRVGDFVSSEQRMFELGDIEERLWAIFLVIDDPSNNNKFNNRND